MLSPLASAGLSALVLLLSVAAPATADVTATNYYNASSCGSSALTSISASSISSCSAASSCTSSLLSTSVYSTVSCPSGSTSPSYASSAFGSRSYVGIITYADTACTTELAATYVTADGNCVAAGSALSYSVTISGGKATYNSYTTPDCSGSALVTYSSIATTSCGSGTNALTGFVVSVNGVTSAAARVAVVPSLMVTYVLAFLGIASMLLA